MDGDPPVPIPDDLSTLKFSESTEIFIAVAERWSAEIMALSFFWNVSNEGQKILLDTQSATEAFEAEIQLLSTDKPLTEVATEVRNKLMPILSLYSEVTDQYATSFADITPTADDLDVLGRMRDEATQIAQSSQKEDSII